MYAKERTSVRHERPLQVFGSSIMAPHHTQHSIIHEFETSEGSKLIVSSTKPAHVASETRRSPAATLSPAAVGLDGRLRPLKCRAWAVHCKSLTAACIRTRLDHSEDAACFIALAGRQLDGIQFRAWPLLCRAFGDQGVRIEEAVQLAEVVENQPIDGEYPIDFPQASRKDEPTHCEEQSTVFPRAYFAYSYVPHYFRHPKRR